MNTPKSKCSLYFPGTSSNYVIANSISGISSGYSAQTISMWIKTDSRPASQILFGYAAGSTPYFSLQLLSNTLRQELDSYTGTNGMRYTGPTLVPGKWYFVTVGWAALATGAARLSTDLTMWLNGAVVPTTTASIGGQTESNNNMCLGQSTQYTTTSLFNGVMYGFSVYPSLLTTPQVQALYDGINLPGAAIIWGFSEGSGTITRDFSGSGNMATVSGCEWSRDIPPRFRTLPLRRGKSLIA